MDRQLSLRGISKRPWREFKKQEFLLRIYGGWEEKLAQL